ncbi:FtsW/RodA/SpoVE family cell cycle protein [Lolliginicoccus levis]|uniref:FtsW/RodA/SpoVE family cell cycle protein n=1 Tax=Lolliginicoccus levis TaxID=2919542 RepID=UPI00241D6C29|nr:FtsW/RodA/SpoVE family cell cycle protein [Lolliginicoccus levis]
MTSTTVPDPSASTGPRWTWHESPVASTSTREWRMALLVAASSGLLVLTSLGRLGWPLGQGILLLIASLVAPLLLTVAVRAAIGPQVSLAMPWAAWFLTCLGLVTGFRLAPGSFITTMLWLGLAVTAFVVSALFTSRWHPRVSRLHAAMIAALGLALMALPLVPSLAYTVGEVRAWIQLGPFTAQPVEFARPLIVISVALLALSTASSFRKATKQTIAITAVPLFAAGLLALYLDDLGPALAIFAGGATIITLCLPKMRYALWLAGAGAVLLGLVYLVSGKVRDRVSEIWEPVLPDGSIRQNGMAQMALSRGGWFGSGFNRGNPTVVPVVESDYVLAGIGEERGYVTLLVIVALFLVISLAGWYSALRARTLAMRLITAGLTAMFSIQAAYVILGNLGVVPMTGMVTPFLSKGGSALIGMWFTIGLIAGAGSRAVNLNAPRSERDLTRRIARVTPGIPAFWVLVVAGTVIATAVVDPLPASQFGSFVPLDKRSDLLARDGQVLASTTHDASGTSRTVHQVAGMTDANQRLISVVDNRIQEWPNCGSWWRLMLDLDCPPQPAVSALSPTVQAAARDALGGVSGDVVVLDTATSSVLAAYSTPDASGRWGNGHPALAADSAPGSTYKIITAAAVLDAGLEGQTESRSEYTPPGGFGTVHNHDLGPAGGTLEEALAESSNTAFAELAIEIGADRIRGMTDAMSGWDNDGTTFASRPVALGGLGDPDAIARTGFGQQDVRATPLAMAHVAAIVATGGTSSPPRSIIGACRGDRYAPTDAPARERVIEPEAAQRIREGMELSVSTGNVPALYGLTEDIAAKTGTAENSDGLYDGWIVAIAPVEGSNIVVAVRVLADSATGTDRGGASSAGPVAASVLRAAIADRGASTNPCAGN